MRKHCELCSCVSLHLTQSHYHHFIFWLVMRVSGLVTLHKRGGGAILVYLIACVSPLSTLPFYWECLLFRYSLPPSTLMVLRECQTMVPDSFSISSMHSAKNAGRL